MPNIALVLKEEIARLARKELRQEVTVLRKATAANRTEIAALKRRLQDLEKQVRSTQKSKRPPAEELEVDEHGKSLRFSAKGLASQRRRLGLSAEDCGLLVGASGQSIYNWEAGKARPRASHLSAIAELRHLGKKSAAARLETLQAAST